MELYTIGSILDYLRESVGDSFTGKDIVCKQDIRNIKRQYNIDEIERHKDDQLSVCAWVTELQSSGGFRVVPRVPWNPSFMHRLIIL